jgi:hypothetical protein
MLRRFLFSAFVLFGIQSLSAQNLIPNGSFESYTSCPTNAGQISLTGNWFEHTLNCTPDLYHACAYPGSMGLPTTAETIYAYDGDGMARIYLYSSFDREYISTQLLDPLQAGHEYAFSMRIRLFTDQLRMVGAIGAHFTEDSLTGFTQTCEMVTLAAELQRDPNDIMDQLGIWYHWEDTLTAVGGEEFIAIGNFLDNASTPVIGTQFGNALYFLDAISLVEIVSVGTPNPAFNYTIAPNPAKDFLSIRSDQNRLNLTVLNLAGQTMMVEQLNGSGNHRVNLNGLTSGIYFLRISTMDGERVEKLVIQ